MAAPGENLRINADRLWESLMEMAKIGPGIAGGTRSDEFVHAVDLFPTILQFAGLAAPQRVRSDAQRVAVDGVSLLPILREGQNRVRDPAQDFLLTESLNLMTEGTRQVGARNGRYKLICTGTVAPAACEFYDLAEDPLEEYPVAAPAAGCAGASGPRDAAWHYCRLAEVIRTESFFAKGR